MRICIYGAGASGGHFAVRLAGAGHDVSVVARGAHLAAIQQRGLTLLSGDTRATAQPRAADDPASLGAQDVVIVAVKATALGGVMLAPLIGPETQVVFPQNGMSWWYPLDLPRGAPAPPDLPIFRLASGFLPMLRIDQVLGGSIYSANDVPEPGVIRNTSPQHNALVIGEVTQARDPRVAALRELLATAGIASPDTPDMRRVVWSKLIVNMSGSTIALATENRSSISRSDPALGQIYQRLVREGMAIAAAHGHDLAGDIDPDLLRARLLDHRPSLLQDYDRHRPMELAEIVQAPQAFARSVGIATPTLDTLAAIVLRRARDRGLVG
jgi:2-dehydropantoate 2-reductase